MDRALLRRYATLAARSAYARYYAGVAPRPHSAYAAWWGLCRELWAIFRARGIAHSFATPDALAVALWWALDHMELSGYFYSLSAMRDAFIETQRAFFRIGETS